jgi:hypothetical protein
MNSQLSPTLQLEHHQGLRARAKEETQEVQQQAETLRVYKKTVKLLLGVSKGLEDVLSIRNLRTLTSKSIS